MRYLLKIWRDSDTADAWRVTLEDIRTREVQRLVNLESLCIILHEHLMRFEQPEDTQE